MWEEWYIENVWKKTLHPWQKCGYLKLIWVLILKILIQNLYCPKKDQEDPWSKDCELVVQYSFGTYPGRCLLSSGDRVSSLTRGLPWSVLIRVGLIMLYLDSVLRKTRSGFILYSLITKYGDTKRSNTQ